MSRRQVNFKLPDELIDGLKRKAAEQGLTATDLVIQGIRLVLELESGCVDRSIDKGIDGSIYGIYEQLRRIEQRIDSRIDNLEAKLPA